jgi:hypothetical protein
MSGRSILWRGLVGAVCLLVVGAPGAFAAAPTNDDFEDAQVLAGPLPIGLSTTNVEATKEEGEPLHGSLGSKGHSVWFEWEATSSGFVTVGTCGSDFATVTAVYTGTKVDELTKVAGGFNDEGPGCPSFPGREVTFRAISGTTYEIAVDGDPYYMPPAEPPLGEGTIELQVKATPVPPNDDFANAEAIIGSIEEEPGAENAFYWALTRGFNWNATRETGEPEHGGPGDASVWYSWTAPESGTASVSACAGRLVLLSLYSGQSLDTLAPVGSQEYPCQATFSASAGATYWIAIDGKLDPGPGDPALGAFSVSISMQLPPRPRPSDPPARPQPVVDLPPNTTITRNAVKPGKRRATFGFQSTDAGSTFRCKLDRHPFKACSSPKSYRNLAGGSHTFKVAAIDAAGHVDATPAVIRFSVPKSRKTAGSR